MECLHLFIVKGNSWNFLFLGPQCCVVLLPPRFVAVSNCLRSSVKSHRSSTQPIQQYLPRYVDRLSSRKTCTAIILSEVENNINLKYNQLSYPQKQIQLVELESQLIWSDPSTAVGRMSVNRKVWTLISSGREWGDETIIDSVNGDSRSVQCIQLALTKFTPQFYTSQGISPFNLHVRSKGVAVQYWTSRTKVAQNTAP